MSSLNSYQRSQAIKNHQNMGQKRFEIFKSQDQEKGHFDLAFDVGGKIIYANKYILTPVSETLAAMCSDRWTTNGEAIKIKDYSYENFHEFLCFLYIGYCGFNEGNIFQLTDMAEFYGVPCLKNSCDSFLYKMKLVVETVEEMFDIAIKYSLPGFLDSLKVFSIYHFIDIVRSEKMMAFKKPFVEFLYESKSKNTLSGALESESFEILYKWAEHKVMERFAMEQQPPEDLNLETAIREEINDIIPNIRFVNMDCNFLINFVVEKGFYLSAHGLFKLFKNLRLNSANEDNLLKNIYDLVEKQALTEQSLEPKNDFYLAEAIKTELAKAIRRIQFYKMSEEFLMDFVVSKGFLSEEQANHVFDVRVELKYKSTVIVAANFKDDFHIFNACDKKRYNSDINYFSKRSRNMFRFPDLKVTTPTTQSTVAKMKGGEWYLCLDKGVLSVKRYSAVKRSDWLIAEMKGPGVDHCLEATLSVSYANI